jgi:pheromone shutdown protein TraB
MIDAGDIKSLEERLSSKLHLLQHKSTNKRVYILGTAHVSASSVADAAMLVNIVKPAAVFLELCDERKGLLVDSIGVAQQVHINDVVKRLLKGDFNVFGGLLAYILHKESSKQGEFAGGEFKAAYEAALKVNSSIILGDRPIQVTLQRTYCGLSLIERLQFALGLVLDVLYPLDAEESKQLMEDLREKQEKVAQEIQDFSNSHPWICEAILNERDKYMTLGIKNLVSEQNSKGDIVAIVGAAHIPGIKKNWELEYSNDEADRLRRFLLLCPDKRGPFKPKDMRTYAKSFNMTNIGMENIASNLQDNFRIKHTSMIPFSLSIASAITTCMKRSLR